MSAWTQPYRCETGHAPHRRWMSVHKHVPQIIGQHRKRHEARAVTLPAPRELIRLPGFDIRQEVSSTIRSR